MSVANIAAPSWTATGDINFARFLTITTPDKVDEAGVGSVIVGISQRVSESDISALAASLDKPVPADVLAGQVSWIVAGAAITAGARLKSDSTGRGIAVLAFAAGGATEQNVGAIALRTAVAAGEQIPVLIRFENFTAT